MAHYSADIRQGGGASAQIEAITCLSSSFYFPSILSSFLVSVGRGIKGCCEGQGVLFPSSTLGLARICKELIKSQPGRDYVSC